MYPLIFKNVPPLPLLFPPPLRRNKRSVPRIHQNFSQNTTKAPAYILYLDVFRKIYKRMTYKQSHAYGKLNTRPYSALLKMINLKISLSFDFFYGDNGIILTDENKYIFSTKEVRMEF